MFIQPPARAPWTRRILLGLSLGFGVVPAQAQTQPLTATVEQAAHNSLRVLGVNALATGHSIVVTGRIDRALRTTLVGGHTLVAAIRGADGALRNQHTMTLNAAELPRRNARDAHFRFELEGSLQGNESVVVVLDPRT
jgi:hypothetical protein